MEFFMKKATRTSGSFSGKFWMMLLLMTSMSSISLASSETGSKNTAEEVRDINSFLGTFDLSHEDQSKANCPMQINITPRQDQDSITHEVFSAINIEVITQSAGQVYQRAMNDSEEFSTRFLHEASREHELGPQRVLRYGDFNGKTFTKGTSQIGLVYYFIPIYGKNEKSLSLKDDGSLSYRHYEKVPFGENIKENCHFVKPEIISE